LDYLSSRQIKSSSIKSRPRKRQFSPKYCLSPNHAAFRRFCRAEFVVPHWLHAEIQGGMKEFKPKTIVVE
jgi:hypothetical protein